MHSSNLIFEMPPSVLFDIYGLMRKLSIPYFFFFLFIIFLFKFLVKLNFFSTFPCSLLQINHYSLFYIFNFWRKIYPKVKVFLTGLILFRFAWHISVWAQLEYLRSRESHAVFWNLQLYFCILRDSLLRRLFNIVLWYLHIALT